jgi:outer membrane protein assembly factor BamB
MNQPKPLAFPKVAVTIVILEWLLWFVLPLASPALGLYGMVGGLLCGVLIIGWWLFFSRVSWVERLAAIVFAVLAVIVAKRFVHASIAGAGQGYLIYPSSIPGITMALVVWRVAAMRVSSDSRGARLALLTAAIALGCVPLLMVRTDGVSSAVAQTHWRWTPTAEELLLAKEGPGPAVVASAPAPAAAPPTIAAAPVAPAPATEVVAAGLQARGTAETALSGREARVEGPVAWPGFRGPERNNVIRGVQIKTDWPQAPPVEMWRRAIGPGWSSFAVDGDLLYTQEQRGDDEVVACYRVSTGEPVWRHKDAARFYESNGGAGPRGTPTVHRGRVYAMGATGILNALDAKTGAVVWSRSAPGDTKSTIPFWGYTSSPIVVDDSLVVSTSGALAAYDLATGAPRWVKASKGGSYSSPQLITIDGVPQIVLLSGPGAIGVAPKDGALLWEHAYEGGSIVQPGITADGDIVINGISAMGGLGTRRLHVEKDGTGWKVSERWTSIGLKPYFNDFVIHKGHAYGFDGAILACIDLADGKRKWKGGRYGNGQLVLLADQDLLMVLSEEGDLALVNALTDEFKEVARFQVLDAKTWNHPVLVGDVLLVRNGEEMAAFKMPVTKALARR